MASRKTESVGETVRMSGLVASLRQIDPVRVRARIEAGGGA
jgi:hypothetical protein